MTGHRALSWAIVAFAGWLAASACSRGDAPQTRDAPKPTPASRPATLLDCVLGVAVRTRQGGLTPEAAARLCHGSVSSTEVATSWEVRTPFSDLSIIGDRASRPTEPALQYSMTIDPGARVPLRALATELGPYSTVAESKTSSVGFNAPGATGQVFAELLSSKVLPDAPVIRVVARAPQFSPP